MSQMTLGITVWIVKDIDVFESRVFSDNFGTSSNLDRALNINILYEEWCALFFNVLNADPERYRDWAQEWDKGNNEEYFQVPGYLMLSRLNDHLVDVSYSSEEVDALRQEAKGLIADTNMFNKLNKKPALNLLRKILTICD